MEAGFVVTMTIVGLVVGVSIGIFIGLKKKSMTDSQGFLYVDSSAPAGQGLFLEQLVPTADIASQKRVVFDVIVIKRNSQK